MLLVVQAVRALRNAPAALAVFLAGVAPVALTACNTQFLAKFPADPLERFVPSNVYMTHPTPLPAWCECRV